MKFVITFLLFAITTTSFSQKLSESRLEFDLKDGYTGESLVSFEKDGFLVYSKSSEPTKAGREWKFDAYDSELDLETSVNITIPKSMSIANSSKDDENLYMIFKDKKSDFIFITLNRKSMKINRNEGELPSKIRLRNMRVLGGKAYFAATYKKALHLFNIDVESGKTSIEKLEIDGFSSKKTKLLKFQLLEDDKEAFVFLSVKTERKENEIYVKKIDEDGSVGSFYHLTKDIEENVIDISASKLNDDTYIYSGTYSTKRITMSEGLIFMELEGDDLNYVNSYSFLDLDEFLSYLPEKKQAKIEKKKKKKEGKGKELILSYLIAGHNLIPHADGFTYIGEAYYPTYRTEYYTSYVNGQAVTRSRQVFDGYQYTHAVIAKFDQDGELMWDRCFEMWPYYKPYYAKRFIEVLENEDDEVKMVFMNSGRIKSMSVDGDGDILQDEESDALETGDEDDKIKRSYGKVDYWYDNYFLAYGSQKIKNKDETDKKKRKRKVFFISKIEF